jgi:hypothetical protein
MYTCLTSCPFLLFLQLAMVLLLQELLPGLTQPPQLYDPAFTPLDCALLQHMGLGVISVNEEGRRSIGGHTTLFFLPHCEVSMCLGRAWVVHDGSWGLNHQYCCIGSCCVWGGDALPRCALQQHMGLGVIPVNEEGRRSIGGQKTLFFLRHCEVRRYCTCGGGGWVGMGGGVGEVGGGGLVQDGGETCLAGLTLLHSWRGGVGRGKCGGGGRGRAGLCPTAAHVVGGHPGQSGGQAQHLGSGHPVVPATVALSVTL